MTSYERIKLLQERTEAIQGEIEAIREQQKVSRANLMLLVFIILEHLAEGIIF